ncbi:poly(3-hydroxyalkanoate) synthetase [Bosea sp. BE125]|uniref:hypothetical protein n=1 Tax=Bosea sp. BE125 TaxID=2817909 RepID=UPI002866F266|nr:hypothetical protein [Bosea sp. BE125]MDR6870377.1 poly(3-hydroxyalkanoate) synthetase [Bosea sp. BE125]
MIRIKGAHNQGIVSPPGRADSHVRIATAKPRERHLAPDRWLQSAAYHEGSWWPHWFEWLAQHSGARTRPPIRSGRSGAHALGAAPGPFVFG